MKFLPWLLLCLMLAGGAAGQAPTPESLLAEGIKLEPDDPVAAMAKYRAAVEKQPQFYAAHVQWLTCLQRLMQQTPRGPERDALTRTLADRFAAASDCAEVDWRFLLQWAGVEADRARLVPAEERPGVLGKMAELAARAVTAAPAGEAQDVARLQQAALLVAKASELTSVEQQRSFYEQAVRAFAAVPLGMITPQLRENWAVALLQLGRLTGIREQQQQALQMLESLLIVDEDNLFRRYNLACAYAVVGQTTNALAGLRQSLGADKSGVVFRAAQTDAEWQELRGTIEFQRVVQAHDPAADKFFGEGLALQTAADRMTFAEQAELQYRAALAQFEQAVRVRPGFVAAHWNMAACYERLATFSVDAAGRLQLLRGAHQQYALAVAGGGTDWKLYHQWGRFLYREVALAFTAEKDQRPMFEQSRTALLEALRRVQFSADQAQIQADLGWCLVHLAQVTPDPKQRLAWNEEATRQFAVAVKVPQVANTARPYAGWGLAQLEIARHNQNRLQFRQAIERLQIAAEKGPRDAEVQFNLSRAYALLRQRSDALRHLRECLALDQTGKFMHLAQTNPDLEVYSANEEFKALLFVPAATPRGIEITPPRVSGR